MTIFLLYNTKYKSTLDAPSQIRLYNHSSANGYVITNGEGVEVANVATDATIENVEVVYDVNSGSFTFKNVHTGNSKPIWIDSIEITYQPK